MPKQNSQLCREKLQTVHFLVILESQQASLLPYFELPVFSCVCVCHGLDEVKGLNLEAVLKCMYRLLERKVVDELDRIVVCILES